MQKLSLLLYIHVACTSRNFYSLSLWWQISIVQFTVGFKLHLQNKNINSRGFLKHFVITTIGMRKRRFDRSTVIIKQVKIKISISNNYTVKQRSGKCKSMKKLKSGVLKTIRTYKNKTKRKLFKNFRTNWVTLYVVR